MKFMIGQVTVSIHFHSVLKGSTLTIEASGPVGETDLNLQMTYTPNGPVPLFFNLHIESEEHSAPQSLNN